MDVVLVGLSEDLGEIQALIASAGYGLKRTIVQRRNRPDPRSFVGKGKLAELTQLDIAVVSRCKKLLSYSKQFQDLMLDPDPKKRVKADFFIELYAVINDRLVTKMDWFSKDSFIRRMLEKYQKRSGLKAVTDFRIVKQYISNARKADKTALITKKLKEFTHDDSLTLAHLEIEAAKVSASARRLLSSVNKLIGAIEDLDVEKYYGEEQLWRKLENLLKIIRAKLQEAGRRLDR